MKAKRPKLPTGTRFVKIGEPVQFDDYWINDEGDSWPNFFWAGTRYSGDPKCWLVRITSDVASVTSESDYTASLISSIIRVPTGAFPKDVAGIILVPGPDGTVDLKKSYIIKK